MSRPKHTRKVGYRAGTNNVPEIRLSGYYLSTLCGFAIGDTVKVSYRRGQIIIERPDVSTCELVEVGRQAILTRLDKAMLDAQGAEVRV